MQTTVGQLLVNEAIPEEYRDYTVPFTKKRSSEIAAKVAAKGDGETYRDMQLKMHQIGSLALRTAGREASISIRDLRIPPKTKRMHDILRKRVFDIASDRDLTQDQKEVRIVNLIEKNSEKLTKTLMDELVETGNPLGTMVMSGARGSPGDVTSILLGDMLVTDHRGDVVPVPMVTGFASGVSPAEYWAGSYGARKGGVATKMATQETGAFGKQLQQVAHRIVVTERDCKTDNGLHTKADNTDNVGTILARDSKNYPAGTVLTPDIMSELGDEDVLVRSVLTCDADGTCSKCAGIRERGKLPEVGENIGVPAAQAVSERVTQAALRVKHTGGRKEKGKDVSGFDQFSQLIEFPERFLNRASVADNDGHVQSIEKAPQGGHYVTIGDNKHYVFPDSDVIVKKGDVIEAGDVISDGIPNPRDVVRHKGIGEGRRRFVEIFMDTFDKAGFSANRRNLEVIAKGLVNHITVNDPTATYGLPGDIMEYSSFSKGYEPREGSQELDLNHSKHRYLERPTLHYSIGTRVTPSVLDILRKNKVQSIVTHEDPPPFEPKVIRALDNLSHAPDWQVRLGGSYLKRGLTGAVREGLGSEVRSTSYIPGLIRGKGFGEGLERTGRY